MKNLHLKVCSLILALATTYLFIHANHSEEMWALSPIMTLIGCIICGVYTELQAVQGITPEGKRVMHDMMNKLVEQGAELLPDVFMKAIAMRNAYNNYITTLTRRIYLYAIAEQKGEVVDKYDLRDCDTAEQLAREALAEALEPFNAGTARTYKTPKEG